MFAPAQHPSDPALLFASLELVERQLVAARLAVGRAFNVEAHLAPSGVRLGRYAAARLVGPDGQPLQSVTGGGGGGGKRGAAAAGLGRGMSGALGGSGRALQREGSTAGSWKRRRLQERSSGLPGGPTASMDDECVVSPTASSKLVERVVRTDGVE